MKKNSLTILLLALTFAIGGCGNNAKTEPEPTKSEVTETVKEEKETAVETEKETEEEKLPDGFSKMTENDAKYITEKEQLVSSLNDVLSGLGIETKNDYIWGNYSNNIAGDKCVTAYIKEIETLADCYYINSEWYTKTVYDEKKNVLYNVDISERNEQKETKKQEETKQEVPHRDGMYGISDKKISDIDASFSCNKVRNDVTGKWRISTIANDIDIEEYVLDYYNSKIHGKDEIHAIVNFTRNTTTRIQAFGSDQIYVTILEYIKGEEHDANELFGGMELASYIIYTDNGDIEEVKD